MCTCDRLAGYLCPSHVRQLGETPMPLLTDVNRVNLIRYPRPNVLGLPARLARSS